MTKGANRLEMKQTTALALLTSETGRAQSVTKAMQEWPLTAKTGDRARLRSKLQKISQAYVSGIAEPFSHFFRAW